MFASDVANLRRMMQPDGTRRAKVGASFRQESLTGTVFSGQAEAETQVRSPKGIRSRVGGWAWIIGYSTIFVDDRDPLVYGFQIRQVRQWPPRTPRTIA